MGGLVTTWPCGEQRRLRRDWASRGESGTSEPRTASYDDPHHRRKKYAEHRAEREIDRQRKELLSAIARMLAHGERAVEPVNETIPQQFQRLVRRWRSETAHVSSIPDLVMHSSYQQIIRLPKNDVLPLILRELRDNGGFWYPALHALTDENPVDPKDIGNVRKMTEAWLKWGRTEGWLLSE